MTSANPVWVSATVLAALATQGLDHAGAEFRCVELARWTDGQLTRVQRTNATSQLIKVGFITFRNVAGDKLGARNMLYVVTAEGAQAISAARKGEVRKSGPKGSRKANPLPSTALAARLWKLLRMRGHVDSDSAAQLLCDAGDENFKRVSATVRKYLLRWANAGALEEGARRVGAKGNSNGFKRYVLRAEWAKSMEPPAWRQIAKAQAAETAPQEARS